MIVISLREFALTGSFGQVKLGMTKNDILEHLGTPDSDNDYSTGYGGLMYGWYEFFYHQKTNELVGIQNDHLSNYLKNSAQHKLAIEFENDKFKIDTWFLTIGSDIKYSEVKAFLAQDGIKYEEVVDSANNHLIKFESGVTLDFDDTSATSSEMIEKAEPNQLEMLHAYPLNGIRMFK